MSTIKSSDEHLTINADGSGKEVKIQRDGTEVLATTSTGIDVSGSVTAASGFLGGSNGGIRIHSGGTKFFNITAANAARDGIMDIGASDARFKDLYLSGNVVLAAGKGIDFSATSDGSGTMTSEVLDDYEEGTWTAVLQGVTTITNTVGYYTKIGRQVNFNFYSSAFTSTGGVAKISGLPYAPTAASEAYTAFTSAHNSWTPNASGGYVHRTSPYMLLVDTGTTTAATSVSGNTKYIMVQGTYFTNA